MLLFSTGANATVWKLHTSKDDFSGKSYSYLMSNQTKPSKPLDFPYKDLTADLYIYCRNPKNLYMRFSSDPNMVGGKIESDYTFYPGEVRIDGKVIIMGISKQHDERKVIRFSGNAEEFIGHKDVAIQIKHYVGTTHYVFDMSNMPKCK